MSFFSPQGRRKLKNLKKKVKVNIINLYVYFKKIKAVYKSKGTNIIEYIKISVNIQKLQHLHDYY